MVLPKPDYDSGWKPISILFPIPPIVPPPDPGFLTLHHGLGTTDLLVNVVYSSRQNPGWITEDAYMDPHHFQKWILYPNEIHLYRHFETHPGALARVRLWKISAGEIIKP